MPDTIIDPPAGEPRPTVTDAEGASGGLRPTVIDEGAPAQDAARAGSVGSAGSAGSAESAGEAPMTPPATPESPTPSPPKRSRAGCAIAAIAATVLVLVGAGLAFYFFFWRYEPVARRHIPGNANIVVRLDPVDVAAFAPVRKHLWPLLEEPRAGKARSARIEDAVGIGPTDVREIIVASTDATSWVVLLGGRFKRGRAVPGLERVAREEGWAGWQRQGDLFAGPGGVSMGQAEDGTVVIGTDAPIVRAALPASDEWKRFGLPEQGALAFAISREAWEGVGAEIGGMLPLGGRGLFRRPGRATGAMTLGAAPRVTMRVEPAAGEAAAALAADLETVVGGLKLVTLLLADQMGEKAALQSAQVQAGPQAVEIRADWPLDGLDRACARLAQKLRGGS